MASESSSTKKLKTTCDEDRISELGNDLLNHILSSVNMKTIVQTCLLSKRWRHLWKSLPCLSFQVPHISSRPDSVSIFTWKDLVDKVVTLRDKSDLRTFSINSYYKCNSGRINTWITYAAMHNVQQLRLSIVISVGSRLTLPDCLFTRKTLRVLQITSCRPDMLITLIFPKNLCVLPHFQFLHLERVNAQGHSIVELLANSPSLQTLLMKRCRVENLSRFDIICGNLTKLVVEGLVFLNVRANLDVPIKISTPNLSSLTLLISDKNDYSLENLTILPKADFDLKLKDETAKNLYARRVMELLQGLSGINDLTLHPSLLEVVSEVVVPDALPCTHNLIVRRLNLKCSYRSCVHAITHLLKIPHIETLVLERDPLSISRLLELDLEIELEGTVQHLKILEMKNFMGSRVEMNFLTLLLKSAPVLENIVLTVSKGHLSTVKERIKKKNLEKFQRRGSPRIFVSFNHPEKSLESMNFIF